jgi:hypothetical protein
MYTIEVEICALFLMLRPFTIGFVDFAPFGCLAGRLAAPIPHFYPSGPISRPILSLLTSFLQIHRSTQGTCNHQLTLHHAQDKRCSPHDS